MARYHVYRHGWNAANQSAMGGSPEDVLVATVEADTPSEAKSLAAKRVTCYNNQYLWTELVEEANKREAEIDARVDLPE